MSHKVSRADMLAEEAKKLRGIRADAGETAAWSRSLESIEGKVYRKAYPAIKYAEILSFDSTPNWADKATYRMVDRVGEAKFIHDYATDFPQVAVFGDETSQNVRSLGDSYAYSVLDLRRAAKTGIALDAELAMAAREAIERKIDAVMAFGDTSVSIPSFVTNANLTAVSRVSSQTWDNSAATGADIVKDVQALCAGAFNATRGAFGEEGTLLVGTKGWATLNNKSLTTSGYTYDNGIKAILASCGWVKAIKWWPQLDLAGQSLTKERILFVPNSTEVLEAILPTPFEQMPPEARVMSFHIACHARVGGVKLRHPKAVAYMDTTES